jgi:DNA invertase Pin-like site-specific DNA recombinase
MPSLIAYLRVSTKRQGESGLGLEAQQSAVEQFATRNGFAILATYVEVESGKRNDRPKLLAAIAHARRSKATLVVAKLDRLSRNAGFLLTLQESGLPIVFCDLPGANEMTIGVMALVARQERQAISERVKVALAELKRRGVKLGSARDGHWTPERHQLRLAGLTKARQCSAESRGRLARAVYSDLVPSMRELRQAGNSFQQIADRLNQQGHSTSTGRSFQRQDVRLILKRSK